MKTAIMSEPAIEEKLSKDNPNCQDKGSDQNDEKPTRSCCSCTEFDGVPEAKGFARLGWGRGPLVMSNLFLSISLIYLAAKEADCLDEEDTIDSDCENRVYGFQPSSLISNIVVISGVLSAFFMPIVGAILDHTSYRRRLGVMTSVIVILFQAVQVYTVESTWFPMLLLQGIAGFFYQVIVLCAFAYLPDLATQVGEEKMTVYTSRFMGQQFGSQVSFGIIVAVVATGFGLDSVQQGQLSQAFNALFSGYMFYIGWYYLPEAPPKHDMLEGETLLTAGFMQVLQTTREINKYYKNSLRWFLIAVIVAEAGTNVFTTLAVVFLQEVLDMSGTETAALIIFTIISSIPGTVVGSMITSRTDPNTSLKLALVIFSLVTVIAGFVLRGSEQAPYAFIFAFLWGILLGWFYSTENLFFSMCLPKGQEAELTGFFMYCTQIMVWFPPLLFTIMNENNVDMKWSLMMTSVYLMLAAGILCNVLPWEQALAEVSKIPDYSTSRRSISIRQSQNSARNSQIAGSYPEMSIEL